jgi:RimJ/RimL family protein N-acetyltransferase
MNTYKALNKQIFTLDRYSLVPIRFEDRYDIMKWRNEQIYHLRQNKPLTKEDQDNYFKHIVANLFQQEQPNQILFSFLKDDKCIGYGGLVHINWIDKNAEVSFIMDTELEPTYFYFYWNSYLNLLKQVAFDTLSLHKTYVYAFDLRPHLYEALQAGGYLFDCRLKEHYLYKNEYKDVVIYSLLNQ